MKTYHVSPPLFLQWANYSRGTHSKATPLKMRYSIPRYKPGRREASERMNTRSSIRNAAGLNLLLTSSIKYGAAVSYEKDLICVL